MQKKVAKKKSKTDGKPSAIELTRRAKVRIDAGMGVGSSSQELDRATSRNPEGVTTEEAQRNLTPVTPKALAAWGGMG